MIVFDDYQTESIIYYRRNSFMKRIFDLLKKKKIKKNFFIHFFRLDYNSK